MSSILYLKLVRMLFYIDSFKKRFSLAISCIYLFLSGFLLSFCFRFPNITWIFMIVRKVISKYKLYIFFHLFLIIFSVKSFSLFFHILYKNQVSQPHRHQMDVWRAKKWPIYSKHQYESICRIRKPPFAMVTEHWKRLSDSTLRTGHRALATPFQILTSASV